MFFSVVIPTYNRLDLLKETLASVRAQTFTDFEVIVVDDGSSDGTWEYLQDNDLGVRCFRQQNGGPGSARNLGIRESEGRYVAFLDSDDLWFPWTLRRYRETIEKTNNPSFVAGCKNVFLTRESLSKNEDSSLRIERFENYYHSGDEWRWYGVSSFVILRDALIEVGGFRDGLVNGEDAELAMKLGDHPGFIQITSPVTFGYRSHGGNVTGNLRRTVAGAQHLVKQENSNTFPGGVGYRQARQRIISRHVRPTSLECLKAGLTSDAWSLYIHTFFWHVRLHRWKYLLGFPLRTVFS